jgi:hypothetical protein
MLASVILSLFETNAMVPPRGADPIGGSREGQERDLDEFI